MLIVATSLMMPPLTLRWLSATPISADFHLPAILRRFCRRRLLILCSLLLPLIAYCHFDAAAAYADFLAPLITPLLPIRHLLPRSRMCRDMMLQRYFRRMNEIQNMLRHYLR